MGPAPHQGVRASYTGVITEMSERLKNITFALLAHSVASVAGAADGAAERRPNVLVILCDDLGYGDLGCYGHPIIRTPNVDRLAAEGLRLTACYAAAANCSPARAGLMTGRTPYRVGIHNWIPMFSPMHLRREEVTIATLLRDAGYATCHVGKWHLNGRFNLEGQPQPNDHGFDHWYSTQNNALPNHRDPDNFVANGTPVGRLEGYSAQLVAEEVVRWLTAGRDKEKPFFLFVCFHEPHEPIATAPRYAEAYASHAAGDESLMAHHGNVTQMDAACGRILRTIDEQGLRKNTFVFFTSDNGPAITRYHPHGSAGPLRGKKGHLYEGGLRVPGIIRWPGHTKAGSICDEPVSGVDLLPTLCALAGSPAPKDRTIDGTNVLALFEGERLAREAPLYWQFNYASSRPKVALRDGPWKILAGLQGKEPQQTSNLTAENMQAIKTAELTGFELYQLEEDIAETKNLATVQPERLEDMKKKLRALYRSVREESPVWPAWKSPGYESGRIRWPAYTRRRLEKR
jgi:arylsulfatase A